MALAPLAYPLYTRVMKHNPANPDWFDRDRFMLSAGHASMLLYSSLYLSGYGLTLDDLKNFRQLGSPTAGHPEYGDARRASRPPPARSARASRWRSAWRSPRRCSRPASTARPRADRPPHLRDRERRRHPGGRGLRGLLARRPPRARQADRLLRQQPHPARRRDRDGASPRTSASASRPTAGTCRTWARTSRVDDTRAGHRARPGRDDRPSLIVASHIGYGSPNKQDTYEAHGSPLGEDEVQGHQGGLRLAPDSPSSCRTRCSSTSQERRSAAARRGGVERAARRVPRGGRRRGRRARLVMDGTPARRLGHGSARVRPGRRRHRHPQGVAAR